MALLEIKNLYKSFRVHDPLGLGSGHLVAVDNLCLTLDRGETLGLVGESGCGKSTTGKLITRLQQAQAGEIFFAGENILQFSSRRLQSYRKRVQMIFQDPFSSLNPRMTIGSILSEPLLIHKLVPVRQVRDRVVDLLEKVGLKPEHEQRYPHEFSGGQRQRVGIARALAVEPELIIADEPVSALDLSVQAQVINLLQGFQRRDNLGYLFIAHDLAVIEHVSDRIAVMYLGRIVEMARTEDLYRHPRHPYTEALMNSAPRPDPDEPRPVSLKGEVPSPVNPPAGCHFHPRCPYADNLCRIQAPDLRLVSPDHQVACHHHSEVGQQLRNRS